jgi:hypothetical protein
MRHHAVREEALSHHLELCPSLSKFQQGCLLAECSTTLAVFIQRFPVIVINTVAAALTGAHSSSQPTPRRLRSRKSVRAGRCEKPGPSPLVKLRDGACIQPRLGCLPDLGVRSLWAPISTPDPLNRGPKKYVPRVRDQSTPINATVLRQPPRNFFDNGAQFLGGRHLLIYEGGA